MLMKFLVVSAIVIGVGTWNVDRSKVERVVDNEYGVVCYVIPQDYCAGECAYSPAISCVKVGKVGGFTK